MISILYLIRKYRKTRRTYVKIIILFYKDNFSNQRSTETTLISQILIDRNTNEMNTKIVISITIVNMNVLL